MNDPLWLNADEVLRLHDLILDASGGGSGLRSDNLLQSALARPQALYSYGEQGIFQLAACYAEAISRNHAFVDGNKRTAIMAAAVFLKRNGQHFQPQRGTEHADMMVELAQGKLSREDAAKYLQRNSRPILVQKDQERDDDTRR